VYARTLNFGLAAALILSAFLAMVTAALHA
jgi:hypothetical protein